MIDTMYCLILGTGSHVLYITYTLLSSLPQPRFGFSYEEGGGGKIFVIKSNFLFQHFLYFFKTFLLLHNPSLLKL